MSAGREHLRLALRGRHGEIEQALLARVKAIADPSEVADPAYAQGLRAAVSAAIEHAISSLEGGDGDRPTPQELLAQARHAARSGVPLDTVLRRYFAGYTLLSDCLAQIAAEEGVEPCELQRSMHSAAGLFDRLVGTVSQEYMREASGRNRTTEERRAARVRMLLAGESLDAGELGYDLDASHLGAIAIGPRAKAALRELAEALGRRLLAVCGGDGALWAWLGAARTPLPPEWARLVRSRWPAEEVLVLGEPANGVEGWRLTHRQAQAALPVAIRGGGGVTLYRDVALVASALSDEVFSASLRRIYLAPLEGERDGGEGLRQTLRAYLQARSVSSAAAALGMSRQTVKNRLVLAEELFGCTLESSATEIEAALRLHEATSGEMAILQLR